MICYKDKSFCMSDCVTTECDRHWSDRKAADAEKWWGKPNAPVAFIDFSKDCQVYRAPK
jgi:hypothetical protein